MKATVKRFTVTVLAGVLAAGMLTGCGEKKLDGTKTVATVNGTQIPMGIVSLYARRSQAQTESMYRSILGQTGNIWSTVADSATGKTYGDQAVDSAVEHVELMYLLKDNAADYGVEITDEDRSAIADAAKAFMEANSEDTITALGVTQEQVETYLELATYEQRMREPIEAQADTTVDEEEAQQASFTYSSFSFSGMEDDAKEELKGKAQELLDKMTADPAADMDAAAKEIDESYRASSGHFTYKETDNEYLTNSYDDAVVEALRSLNDGEVCGELVETDTSFYVLRMDTVNDEEQTQNAIDSEINSIQSAYYSDTTQGWLDAADVKIDDKVLKTLNISDNHTFTIVYDEEETEEEIPVEDLTAEAVSAEETAAQSESEAAAAEMTEAASEESTAAAAETTEAASEEATVAAAETTEAASEETTVAAAETTEAASEETTAAAVETTEAASEETTAAAAAETTEAAPEETTVAAAETTEAASEESTAAAAETTEAASEETTTASAAKTPTPTPTPAPGTRTVKKIVKK